jgi:hypothetical protein
MLGGATDHASPGVVFSLRMMEGRPSRAIGSISAKVPGMGKRLIGVLGAFMAWTGTADVTGISVPNGSFESPATAFVSTHVDSWQKTPQPADYDDSGGYQWEQLAGVFLNTAPTSADHLDNLDGPQAMYVFAVPKIGVFQDYDSTDWSHPAPPHAFDASFEVGKAYTLTVGINGGGGGMVTGASFELSLYYRDEAGKMVAVAATVVTHSPEIFPNHTHMFNYQVRVPTVAAGDPWAGRKIGIQLLSTVSSDLQGGYWDVDNVRLSAEGEPVFSLNYTATDSDLRVSWLSTAGRAYQLESSEDFQTWTVVDTPLTGTGGELFKLVSTSGRSSALFRVRILPPL